MPKRYTHTRRRYIYTVPRLKEVCGEDAWRSLYFRVCSIARCFLSCSSLSNTIPISPPSALFAARTSGTRNPGIPSNTSRSKLDDGTSPSPDIVSPDNLGSPPRRGISSITGKFRAAAPIPSSTLDRDLQSGAGCLWVDLNSPHTSPSHAIPI